MWEIFADNTDYFKLRIKLLDNKSRKWHQNITSSVIFPTRCLSRLVAVPFPCLLASSRVSRVVSRIERAEKSRKWEEETGGKVSKQQKEIKEKINLFAGAIDNMKQEIKMFIFKGGNSELSSSTHLFLRYVLVINITISSSSCFRHTIHTSRQTSLPHSLGGEPVAYSCSSPTTNPWPLRDKQNNQMTSVDSSHSASTPH